VWTWGGDACVALVEVTCQLFGLFLVGTWGGDACVALLEVPYSLRFVVEPPGKISLQCIRPFNTEEGLATSIPIARPSSVCRTLNYLIATSVAASFVALNVPQPVVMS
jgi:hypothetical protein